MIETLVNKIAERLEAERVPGRALEAIKLIRVGDIQPIPSQSHPAITIEAGDMDIVSAIPASIHVKIPVNIYMYVVSMASGDVAARELLHHIWYSDHGADKGIVPAISKLCAKAMQIENALMCLRLTGTVDTAVADDSSTSTGVARVTITAETKIPAMR
ncbi:MAG: hypothetical protein K6G50_05995 [bacterium]|nr:hypothetical protein [bacterium]